MTVQETKSTALEGRHPASFFAPIQREIDRVFADFGDFNLPDVLGTSPRMDLYEANGGVELTVELPGLSKQDVKIELEDDILTVSGEKRFESEEKKKDFRFVERRYGAFSRSVRLPHGTEADKITATLKDGVLKVTAPRAEGETAGKISIPVKAG